MSTQIDTIIPIRLGFLIDGIHFGWHDGKLYQLPYNQSGRYYGLRLLRQKKAKNGWVYYHVRRKKLGLEKLKAMLKPVNWNVSKPVSL